MPVFIHTIASIMRVGYEIKWEMEYFDLKLPVAGCQLSG